MGSRFGVCSGPFLQVGGTGCYDVEPTATSPRGLEFRGLGFRAAEVIVTNDGIVLYRANGESLFHAKAGQTRNSKP